MACLHGGPRHLQAKPFHRLGRRHANLCAKNPREVARAHCRLIGEALDRELLGKTLAHPEDHLRKAAAPPAQFDKGGELRLPSGAALVDDQLLSDPPRDLGTQILLDQRERQVDTG
jgi:hypothetical protein